jgi:hypothetical protein
MDENFKIQNKKPFNMEWGNIINALIMLFTGVIVLYTQKSVKTSIASVEISRQALELTQKSISSSDSVNEIYLELIKKTADANTNLSKSFQENLSITKKSLESQINENQLYHDRLNKESLPSMEISKISVIKSVDDGLIIQLAYNCFCKYEVDLVCTDLDIKYLNNKEMIWANYDPLHFANFNNCQEINTTFSSYTENGLFLIKEEYFSMALLDSFLNKQIFPIITGKIVYKNRLEDKYRKYTFVVQLILIDNPYDYETPRFSYLALFSNNSNIEWLLPEIQCIPKIIDRRLLEKY